MSSAPKSSNFALTRSDTGMQVKPSDILLGMLDELDAKKDTEAKKPQETTKQAASARLRPRPFSWD